MGRGGKEGRGGHVMKAWWHAMQKAAAALRQGEERERCTGRTHMTSSIYRTVLYGAKIRN